MATRRLLADGERFSSPRLWDLQRAYFERNAIDAWRSGAVPHYVTSNPFVGAAYARIVAAFIRDCLDAGTVDPTQPVYVLELGAGSGRFSFQFLRHFFDERGTPR